MLCAVLCVSYRLNSPQHTEPQVVKAITSVVPNTNREHALNWYVIN